VNHVARRSNELDVEKVQPAAFTFIESLYGVAMRIPLKTMEAWWLAMRFGTNPGKWTTLNAAAQSYRQITAIHRTSAGDLRHPDVDGSRCISGTPAAQRMSRTVSAADFFMPGRQVVAI